MIPLRFGRVVEFKRYSSCPGITKTLLDRVSRFKLIKQNLSKMADFETGKKAAAIKSVDIHVKSGDIVGIGSGSTIVYAVARLAELIKVGSLSGIQCVPTSFQVCILKQVTGFQ